jgi:hypothetical protein
MPRPTRETGAMLKYFQASAAADLPKRGEFENCEALQLSDTAFLFNGQNAFHLTRGGHVVESPARFTFLITKETEGWRIKHFHSSRRPPPRQ